MNHILGKPWLLSYWLVRYGLMKESLLYLLMCLGNFYQKKTSIALQLHMFILPKPYVDLRDKTLYICALLLHWASSNFVTLVRCLSYLFDQDHLHSNSQTSTLEVSYAILIHPQNENSMFNDLSLVSPKRGMGYSKKREKREKMACPRSMTQKKNKIFGHMKVQRKIKKRK